MPKILTQSNYSKLITTISSLYENARKSLAVFYWQTGKVIVEEEQNGNERSDYGSGLLNKLSEDLSKKYGTEAGFSRSNLENMRRFYLTHKNSQAPGNLEWTKYIELLRIKDNSKRRQLELQAVKENLSSRDIRKLVNEIKINKKDNISNLKTVKTTSNSLPPLKPPKDLELNTYKKLTKEFSYVDKKDKEQILLDFGFFVIHSISEEQASNIIITDTPSYTYSACVEKVVDGDTILVVIDLGFDIWVREKLRLRGIDTPEMNTPQGVKAKAYTESLLPIDSQIILKTHQTDIYGRFVADVFYLKQNSYPNNPEEIIKNGIYLNQQLLDEGYAVRMEE